ncbi:hypothetical protein BDV25DRAFT_156658 [Aspergillus avenaceus]|uniref:Arf-GAP domain-containing protein n=1 Tax=Aspergillus avenaceus TaxID=36643 RepID=A0A5N6TSI0_ASPAV|nr:hypothetical protein BDV25DRAFT_156658 [Aspergillus avenaceus]
MVAGISKRQQFRNERALQDLVRSVPGNDRCADCQAMNPGWASWNLGIFLCMRCAALHRKMGTHISKVKSLSMDSWTTDQVDNMKSHGNNIMNKIFNPRNVKTPVPTDVDESDACMERFIRQKYQHRSLDDGKPKPPSRQDTGNDKSPEGSPPPLPPKPSRPLGLGLRSASSTTSLHRLSTRQASSEGYGSPSVTISAGTGANVGNMSSASFDSKMATLRSMGFTNEYRNSAVLRGLDGNLDKSIETLVRLGEGSNPTSRGRTPVQASTAGSSTTQQPSTNPFDQLDAKPSAQPTGNSYYPFDVPTVQQPPAQSFEASFQNLQVSQPLFPHSTGGYPRQQAPFTQSMYQQPITPPVAPNVSQGAFVQSPQPVDNGHNPFFQPSTFAAPAPNQGPGLGQTNPFFTPPPQPNPMQAQSQAPAGYPHPPRHANTMPALSSTSPFGHTSPFQQQQPQQQQQQQQQLPAPQLQLQPSPQIQGSHNPFQPMTAPPTPQSAGYQAQSQLGLQPPAQHLAPQTTGRMDKSSILSLYGLSPPPSATSEQAQFPSPAGAYPTPGSTSPFPPTPQSQQFPNQQPVDSQAAGTRNPFLSAQQAAAPNAFGYPPQQQQQPHLQLQQPQPQYTPTFNMPMNPTQAPATNNFPRSHGHMSQQSVDINAFQTGRHSPDAFASLSARYG